MQIVDSKFYGNKSRYIIQAAFGAGAVAVALLLFDVVNQPMIIASFGASAFIVFTRPQSYTADARHVIGAYIIGILVGCTFHWVTFVSLDNYTTLQIIHVVAAAFAVGLSMFLMAITNTEHAPGTSIALAFAINDWTLKTIVLVMIGIIFISIIHKATKRWMVDVL